jgi:hypothetical protein
MGLRRRMNVFCAQSEIKSSIATKTAGKAFG